MSHKDYTKFSNRPETPVVEPVVEKVEDIKVEPVIEEAAAPEEQKPVYGIVTDCLKLNVRMNPRRNSKVLTVIDAEADVAINEEESTEEFYKVCTASGIEGYCMKKFITIKP